jgi:hypothetical protein
LAIVIANIVLVVKIPRSFLPAEDQGYLLAMVALPDGSGINRTKAFMDDLTPKLRENPAVRHTFAISGFDLLGGGERTNSGTIFLPLKDFGTRPPGGEALARQLNAIGMTQPDGMCLVVNPPAIRGIGSAGGFEFYLQAKDDDDPARLAAIDGLVAEALAEKKMPGCVVCIGRREGIAMLKAYGRRAVAPADEPMTIETVFDLASLTKPVATASVPAARKLAGWADTSDIDVSQLAVQLRIAVAQAQRRAVGSAPAIGEGQCLFDLAVQRHQIGGVDGVARIRLFVQVPGLRHQVRVQPPQVHRRQRAHRAERRHGSRQPPR